MRFVNNTFNMNTNIDKIDKYLTSEMSDNEMAIFESELSNDLKLKEDLEFVKSLKSELKDRNEKIRLIKGIKAKQKRNVSFAISTVSIAAAIVLGFIIVSPQLNTYSPQLDMGYYDSYRASGDITNIASLINNKEYKTAMQAIEQEEASIIQEIEVITQNSSENDSVRVKYELELAQKDQYEISWLKANALIGLKENQKAIEILNKLSQKSGAHKEDAITLLKRIKE